MKKKTRKVPKPKVPPLKVEAIEEAEFEDGHINVVCKEQLIELAKKFKQPLFFGKDDNVLFFIRQGIMFWRTLDEDEVKELDYDEWVEEDD